ncbi:unnamed protein product [Schistocephalus solidus]|uniref:CASP-like protein n=1 Tax=Schistocephalus solidus TaxID=70667 RepID=A0A183TLU3_SCHSO|nr:unnamed protein product [Schistocephalus solidus]
MRFSLVVAVVLVSLLAQKTIGVTIQEAEASGQEEYLMYFRDNNFNVIYHAGIALILLYVMLGTLVSTIALVTRFLGHHRQKII